MTKSEKKNGIVNLENTANTVAKELGWSTVLSVLKHYGATSIENLSPATIRRRMENSTQSKPT